jgi:hypothetical protein
MEYALPTATTLFFNRHRLKGELKTVDLPAVPWAQKEAHELLTRSDERLRSLETKGPGLATVAAIVAAGVVAATVESGGDSTLYGTLLLGIAAWYSIWSLVVPIYLVGPQARATIDLNQLAFAAGTDDPEQYLAVQAQRAAQSNVRRTQRIANLQNAARVELSVALGALSLWLLLGPALGLLERDAPAQKSHPHAQRQTTTSPTTSARTVAAPAPSASSGPPASRGLQQRVRTAPVASKTGGTESPIEPR